MINSLQELYGDLPIESLSSNTTDGLLLPLDDNLSMNIYQALQRFLGIPTKTTKSVNEKKLNRKNKKNNKQGWSFPSQNELNVNSTRKTYGPSLQEIMNEELNYNNTHKSVQVLELLLLFNNIHSLLLFARSITIDRFKECFS